MIAVHADLLNTDIPLFLTLVASSVFALLVGIGFHEFCHAFMADSLGDRLPAAQGRLTLNPLKHLDPLGTMMMLFVGFGWGKPVEVSLRGTRVSPKTAMLLVSLAGPTANFAAAGLLALPIKLGWAPYINPLWDVPDFIFRREVQTTSEYAGLFLTGAVYLNVILGVFNLLPVHPLDGFKVAVGLLPDHMAREFAKLAQYGPGILMLLIALPLLIGYSPLSEIMGPSVEGLVGFFTGTG